jgi:hypothetical protein
VPLADLRRRLLQMLACAVTTYAWLIGTAGLLLGTTPAWQAALVIALGGAAVPLWWGAMRDTTSPR